jgi:hypothetical protein
MQLELRTAESSAYNSGMPLRVDAVYENVCAQSLVPFADTAVPLIDQTSNPARFKEAVRHRRPMGSTD